MSSIICILLPHKKSYNYTNQICKRIWKLLPDWLTTKTIVMTLSPDCQSEIQKMGWPTMYFGGWHFETFLKLPVLFTVLKVAVLLDSSCQFQETTSDLNLRSVEKELPAPSFHQQRRAHGAADGLLFQILSIQLIFKPLHGKVERSSITPSIKTSECAVSHCSNIS
jgi:hypothetical protein